MNKADLQRAWTQLQTLDAQNPGAWPDWVRTAAAILLTVAIAAAGYWYFVKPRFEAAERARQQEQALRADFEKKQRRAASLEAYRERLALMDREFGQMLRQLPGKAEVANLLNDISQARAAANLDEELFEPQGEVMRDFYAELPNRIVVVGTYHDMGYFVSSVAALARIVTVENVEITPLETPRGEQPADDPQLRMSAIAKTYRYLDDEELAAQRAAEQARQRGRRR